jgi:hypothetical protein
VRLRVIAVACTDAMLRSMLVLTTMRVAMRTSTIYVDAALMPDTVRHGGDRAGHARTPTATSYCSADTGNAIGRALLCSIAASLAGHITLVGGYSRAVILPL